MARPAALIALVAVVVVALAVVLTGRGDGYRVRATFLDAGQLVKGNLVQVAGRRIGLVDELRVTDDGRAEVVLDITDERYQPLRRGTRMTIRTTGLSGIANRFIDVSPAGTSAPEIEDGGVIETSETTGIVDLDVLFNAFGPATRKDLQRLFQQGADGFAGEEAQVNRLLRYLNPAAAQTRAVLEDVTQDQAAVERLLGSGSAVAGTLAARGDDVARGIRGTADTFDAIAREPDALDRTLRRAPAVLARARPTLRGVDATLRDLRPALREARPVAPRLATTLRRIGPVADAARPVLPRLDALLDPLRRTLRALPALSRAGVPALQGAASAITASQPVFAGLRPYTLDMLHGLVIGPGGATGHYDANGNYARVMGLGSVNGGRGGIPSLVPDVPVPLLSGETFGNTSRCPGSADPGNARDGSTPYVPEEAACDR